MTRHDDRDRRAGWAHLFRPWPMLAGAITCFALAATTTSTERQETLTDVLIVVGTMLVGAWIVLLSVSGHSGRDQ